MYPTIGAIVVVAVVVAVVSAYRWRYVSQVRPKPKQAEARNRVVVFGATADELPRRNGVRRKRSPAMHAPGDSDGDRGDTTVCEDVAIDVPTEPAPSRLVNRLGGTDQLVERGVQPPPRRHSFNGLHAIHIVGDGETQVPEIVTMV